MLGKEIIGRQTAVQRSLFSHRLSQIDRPPTVPGAGSPARLVRMDRMKKSREA
jgi:hypothetical protein